jgi:predicted oxidoreductase
MEKKIKISSPIAGCMRWGAWGANFSVTEYRAMIDACMEQGITSFDHADIYGHYTTEAEFGAALREAPSLRQQMQLISKCGIQLVSSLKPEHLIKSYNTSAGHIIAAAEASLQHLNTDYLDVLLIHRPDPLLHPEEIAQAITHLLQQGKIRSFGVSNFLPRQIDMLQRYIQIDFNQVEVSVWHLSAFTNGILDSCLQYNIQPMAWAALGGGRVTDEEDEKNAWISSTAKLLAEKYKCSLNQILIAFLLKHPAGIIPVLGTTKIERLAQAHQAASISITREEWFMLWRASTGEDIA